MNTASKRDRFLVCVKRWNVLPLILDALLLGAIITQAVIYSKQLSEMRKSTDAATSAANSAKQSIDQIERNAHLDQRAWVTVEIAKILKAPALDETPTVTLHIKNSGKTPARKFRVTGSVYIGDHADIVGRDKEPI